jgi:hypothetical protein
MARADSTPRSELVLNQLRGVALIGPGVVSDRRNSRERRQLTLWTVLYGGVRRRRLDLRRSADESRPLLDLVESHLPAVVVTILLLCCADALLTLELLKAGASELNPLMNKLLSIDVTLFTAAKMALTGAGIIVLVLASRFRLFGRIRVVQGLHGILIGYLLLVLYELALLASI